MEIFNVSSLPPLLKKYQQLQDIKTLMSRSTNSLKGCDSSFDFGIRDEELPGSLNDEASTHPPSLLLDDIDHSHHLPLNGSFLVEKFNRDDVCLRSPSVTDMSDIYDSNLDTPKKPRYGTSDLIIDSPEQDHSFEAYLLPSDIKNDSKKFSPNNESSKYDEHGEDIHDSSVLKKMPLSCTKELNNPQESPEGSHLDRYDTDLTSSQPTEDQELFRHSLDDIFYHQFEAIDIGSGDEKDKLNDKTFDKEKDFVDAEMFFRTEKDQMNSFIPVAWKGSERHNSPSKRFPTCINSESPGVFFGKRSAELDDLHLKHTPIRKEKSQLKTQTPSPDKKDEEGTHIISKDDLSLHQYRKALTTPSMKHLQKKFSDEFQDSIISQPVLDELDVDVGRATPGIVADAVQAALFIKTPRKMEIGWPNIDPTTLVDTSLDAAAAIGAMIDATDKVEDAVTDAIRMGAHAAKAVEIAISAEAIAIAQQARSDSIDNILIQESGNTLPYTNPSSPYSNLPAVSNSKNLEGYDLHSSHRNDSKYLGEVLKNNEYPHASLERKNSTDLNSKKYKLAVDQSCSQVLGKRNKSVKNNDTREYSKSQVTSANYKRDKDPQEEYHRHIDIGYDGDISLKDDFNTSRHRSSVWRQGELNECLMMSHFKTSHVTKNNYNINSSASIDKPRLCKRILVNLGSKVTESFWFRNFSNSMARIYNSLIPLSTGCQQFRISPTILEIDSKQAGKFNLTFEASILGPVVAILQFKSLEAKEGSPPYEVILDAVVKENKTFIESEKLKNKYSKNITCNKEKRVDIHEESQMATMKVTELACPRVSTAGKHCCQTFDIHPTFIRFSEPAEVWSPRKSFKEISKLAQSIEVSNNSNVDKQLSVTCSFNHIQIQPREGMIQPNSSMQILVWPISRPSMNTKKEVDQEPWYGTFSVSCGEYRRELSVVIDTHVLQSLPGLDEVARRQHNAIVPYDADTHTHTSKPNRHGLYFSTEKAECGRCPIGETRTVHIKLCNATNSPMTVFVQYPRRPFYIRHNTIDFQPRSFVHYPIKIKTNRAGKYSTSIQAFSVSHRCQVRLVAEGV